MFNSITDKALEMVLTLLAEKGVVNVKEVPVWRASRPLIEYRLRRVILSKRYKANGTKECARRLRQANAIRSRYIDIPVQ